MFPKGHMLKVWLLGWHCLEMVEWSLGHWEVCPGRGLWVLGLLSSSLLLPGLEESSFARPYNPAMMCLTDTGSSVTGPINQWPEHLEPGAEITLLSL